MLHWKEQSNTSPLCPECGALVASGGRPWTFALFKNCIYLFLAVLGLRYCLGFSLVAASGGCSQVVMPGLLLVLASLVAEHELWGTCASVIVMLRLS